MRSQIDDQLTKEERTILEMYRNPKDNDIQKQIHLAFKYAIGTGIFLGLAIILNQPYYSIGIFVTFLAFLIIRIIGAKKIAGIMPKIIEKYEKTIKDLKNNK